MNEAKLKFIQKIAHPNYLGVRGGTPFLDSGDLFPGDATGI